MVKDSSRATGFKKVKTGLLGVSRFPVDMIVMKKFYSRILPSVVMVTTCQGINFPLA